MTLKIRKMHLRTLRRMANSVRMELTILPGCENYTQEVDFVFKMLEKAYALGIAEGAKRAAEKVS